jgi:hypothetical protein
MFSSHLCMVLMVSDCLNLGLGTIVMCRNVLVDTDRQSGYWPAIEEFLGGLDNP